MGYSKPTYPFVRLRYCPFRSQRSQMPRVFTAHTSCLQCAPALKTTTVSYSFCSTTFLRMLMRTIFIKPDCDTAPYVYGGLIALEVDWFSCYLSILLRQTIGTTSSCLLQKWIVQSSSVILSLHAILVVDAAML